ncbi:hypothetical protein AKJ09_05584 [Labilithrix luteola]|uniref:Lipoprotein n=1 Tax=Labilithrix luteola TaxID=1391654 RepID=A0A0K1PZF8_9BACT|nr:hypothetical protein [Labilithrix luteola]AKU98920.1 hypothetical protein AKJ09_05584 [Labilithrix luteola]
MKLLVPTGVLGFAFAFALAAGCSNSDRPAPAEIGSGNNTPGKTTGTTGETLADSGSSGSSGTVTDPDAPFDPAACTDPPELGNPLQELGEKGAAPTPSGGEITAGTYILDEMYKSVGGDTSGGPGEQNPTPGTGPTGHFAQKTIVLKGGNFSFLEAEGEGSANNIGAPVYSAGTYVAQGTNIVLTKRCEGQSGAVTYGYFASGLALTLFRDASRREVYHRKP